LLASFGQTGKGWAQGDFNGDTNVNFADFQNLLANFGLSGGTGQVAAVPEPTSILLGAFGLIGLGFVRRGNRKLI